MLKSAIKRLLRFSGYSIIKYTPPFGHAINLLELAVRCRVAENQNCFVLQIGANDGKMDDPLYPLITRYKLKGLLVEPVPEYFAELQHTYADQPQLRFENSAIDDRNGVRTFYRVRNGIYDNPRVRGMAGFHRRSLLSASGVLKGLKQHIEEFKVQTRTLEDVLARHDVGRVDLLVVDTEGHDYDIIRLAFQAGLRPAIIYYEHVHLSPDQADSCRRLLVSHDYRFANAGQNTLAMRAAQSDS